MGGGGVRSQQASQAQEPHPSSATVAWNKGSAPSPHGVHMVKVFARSVLKNKTKVLLALSQIRELETVTPGDPLKMPHRVTVHVNLAVLRRQMKKVDGTLVSRSKAPVEPGG